MVLAPLPARGNLQHREYKFSLQFVQPAILLFQISYEVIRTQVFVRSGLNQVARKMAAALRMNVLPKPSEKRTEITRLEHFLQIAKVLFRFGVKLRCIHVAEGVAWELADCPRRPVHVLPAMG